jgi:hypothetical protein
LSVSTGINNQFNNKKFGFPPCFRDDVDQRRQDLQSPLAVPEYDQVVRDQVLAEREGGCGLVLEQLEFLLVKKIQEPIRYT